jgi:hypothetical protein
MSRVEEIESQIEQLPPGEFARVANWIREMDQQRWDEQLDRDAASGKLDVLLAEARAERESGLLKDWPPAA